MNKKLRILFLTTIAALLAIIPGVFALSYAPGTDIMGNMWTVVFVGGIILLYWNHRITLKEKGRDVPGNVKLTRRIVMGSAIGLICGSMLGPFFDMSKITPWLLLAMGLSGFFLYLHKKGEEKIELAQGGTDEGAIADELEEAREAGEGGLKRALQGVAEAEKEEEGTKEKIDEAVEKGEMKKEASEEVEKAVEWSDVSKEIFNTIRHLEDFDEKVGRGKFKKPIKKLWKAIYKLHDENIEEIHTLLELDDVQKKKLKEILALGGEKIKPERRDEIKEEIGQLEKTEAALETVAKEEKDEKVRYKKVRRKIKVKDKTEGKLQKDIGKLNEEKLKVAQKAIKHMKDIKIEEGGADVADAELTAARKRNDHERNKLMKRTAQGIIDIAEKTGKPELITKEVKDAATGKTTERAKEKKK